MPKIKLLQSFAGEVGGLDSPSAGQEIDVSTALAEALCDGERAVLVSGTVKTSRPRREKATRTPRGEKRG